MAYHDSAVDDPFPSIPHPRIMVLNPNTSATITALLQNAADRCAPPGCTVITTAVAAGPTALRTADDLAIAEHQVLATVRARADLDGLVIAAFGDPGLAGAQAAAGFPVVGLGSSGMQAAAAHGRFAILTLGRQMDGPLRARVADSGLAGRLTGLRFLDADIPDVAAAPDRFLPLIEAEARIAAAGGAQALLLGGAPFAGLGQRVGGSIPVLDGLACALNRVLVQIMARPPVRARPARQP